MRARNKGLYILREIRTKEKKGTYRKKTSKGDLVSLSVEVPWGPRRRALVRG